MTFLKALAVFLGTVIGVGVFSLPFIASKAGFFVVLGYLIAMAIVVIIEHLVFSEIVLGTEEKYRFSGYVGMYLGKGCKNFTFITSVFGFFGVLLAYLIIGGEFLRFFASAYFPASSIFYTALFFICASIFVFLDIKVVSRVALCLIIAISLILIIFLIKAFPLVNADYFRNFNASMLAFPFGAVLFSLWGASIIPEVEEMFIAKTTDKKIIKKGVKSVVVAGTVISAIFYIIFIFAVFGVSGPSTSTDAISGLYDHFAEGIIKLGFLFGIISCFTSFVSIALTLKKTFWFDYGVNKNLAFFLACSAPFIFFLLGAREFIKIISLTGALTLGIEGIATIFLYRAFLKKIAGKKINPALYSLIFVFALGIFLEAYYFFVK